MQKEPPPTPPLRKATYVTIETLVNRQYNIDLERLHEELEKAKQVDNEDDAPADGNGGSNDESGNSGDDVVDESNTANKSNDVPTPQTTSTPTKGAWTISPFNVLPSSPPPSDPSFRENAQGELPSFNASGGGGSSSGSVKKNKYFPHSNRLTPPRDGFNLCLLVGKVDLVVDKLRVDSTRVLVAEVSVGDSTGSISLRARDDQIDLLKQVSKEGGAVVLRNCTMELYQGRFLRLVVGKWGKINVYPDGIESTPNPPTSMNQELNFSLVDLNEVATLKVHSDYMSPVRSSGHHQRGGHTQPFAPNFHQQQQQHEYPKYDGYKVEEKSLLASGHQQNHQAYRRQSGASSQMSPSSPPYAFHDQRGVSTDPYYPQYDAGSVYSYQSQQQDQMQGSPPHSRQQYHHHLPSDHYNRQQQLLCQQYELQQQHAYQMQMVQDTQRRMIEQQQLISQSSVILDLSAAESHETMSVGDYSVPSLIGPAFQLPASGFPPVPAPPSVYPYGTVGEQGQQPRGIYGQYQQQQPGAIISPPVSPQHFGHSGPAQAPPPPHNHEGRRKR
eukprot:g6348.t1 g6348   contig23:259412-261437(-)